LENDKDQERRTMNTDNTQDGAEPSPASAGSQPVAWWVTLPGRDFPYLSHIEDRALFCQKEEPGSEVVPLYRHPQPMLTDEERAAIQRAIDSHQHRAAEMHSRSWAASAIKNDCDTLRALLD
jgi:hypothetical protein